MSRNFKVNDVLFSLSNVANGGNITELPYKYDLNMFSSERNYWVRLCGCKTIADGKEKAREFLESDYR